QPKKSDTRNLETAVYFARTSCAWSDRPHARACTHRRKRRPYNSSGYKAVRHSFRMKTRRYVCLCFRNDRTSAGSANLPLAHRRIPFPRERAGKTPFRGPGQKGNVSKSRGQGKKRCGNEAPRPSQGGADENKKGQTVFLGWRGRFGPTR